jgi:hypothetical protein
MAKKSVKAIKIFFFKVSSKFILNINSGLSISASLNQRFKKRNEVKKYITSTENTINLPETETGRAHTGCIKYKSIQERG